MRTPLRASATASSISGMSVTQTGQPGPMITSSARGKIARRPNRAIACSWLPQTCITDTGSRPISPTRRSSSEAIWAARAGSRNCIALRPASIIFFRPSRLSRPGRRRPSDLRSSRREQLLVKRERLCTSAGGMRRIAKPT